MHALKRNVSQYSELDPCIHVQCMNGCFRIANFRYPILPKEQQPSTRGKNTNKDKEKVPRLIYLTIVC